MIEFTVSLDSQIFSDLRDDFNDTIQETLSGMLRKGADSATINVKLQIKLPAPMEGNYSMFPEFFHKVQSTIQSKSECKGGFIGRNEKLVFDPDLLRWVIRPIDEAQQSFFQE